MIDARELRIGNFIYDDGSCIAKIVAIKPFDHSVRADEDEGCLFIIDIHKPDGEVWRSYETDSPDCKPIPLTPEVLEKCGFTYCPYDKDLIQCPKKYYQIYMGYPMVFRTPGASLANIKHLHQLQNLYWCLTGTELNYQP